MSALILCMLLSSSVTNLDDSHTAAPVTQAPLHSSRTAPALMPGWPVQIPSVPTFAPTGVVLADIDEDGSCEVLTGTTMNAYYVWDYAGHLMSGWPKTGIEEIQTKAAVADIDTAYPGLEIIVPGRANTLYAWHNDGTNVPGWPQTVGETGGFKSAVIFDLDADGDLEIILGQRNYPDGTVRVYHHDGTPYAGWPKTVDYMCVATPSVGDIDNDGTIEICALSFYSVYLWDKDGNDEPGWPKLNAYGGTSYAQPVLCDVTEDGYAEVIYAYYTNYYDSVNIYQYDGTGYAGWPKSFPGPQAYVTPVAADIDADGDYEIFGGGHSSDQSFLARHHTGAPVAGWPVDVHNLECSPIVFDLDDDGDREVIVGENDAPGRLMAFHGNGTMVDDWPITLSANVYVNSASVADVDADGDIEIGLICPDGNVYLWTIEDVMLRPYLVDWGTFFHDNWNTGWVHPLPPANLIADFSGDTVTLSWDENTEPDIAGYHVYRSAVTGGPYTRINETTIPDPMYVDIPGTGEYYYCVTAQIQALTESRLSNEVYAPVGVEEHRQQEISGLTVYPNPFRTHITFSTLLQDDMRVRIYDITGSLIDEITGKTAVTWESTCPQGIYFAGIKIGDQEEMRKIIKLR